MKIKLRVKKRRVDFEYTGQEPVPKNVTHVYFHPSVRKVEGYEYADDGNLDDHKHAFQDCKNLKEVVLNEGLVEIGKYAFYCCTSLESISFPSTMRRIGMYAFSDCSKLEEIVLNEGIKKIDSHSFNECKSLSSIHIPSTLKCIGGGVFKSCSDLKQVVFSEGLREIEHGVFFFCTSLQTITLPSTLLEIGDDAFHYCYSLWEVVLNEGLKKIRPSAFRCCAIQSIIIPTTVTDIENFAFADTSLRHVLLNESIQRIGPKAFYNCERLEKLMYFNISTRLEYITKHYPRAEAKIDEVRGLVEKRDSKLFVSAAEMGGGKNWNIIKQSVDKIVKLVTYYEMREAATFFELALWKAKLRQAEDDFIDRDAYRIEVPGPAQEAILQYLSS